MSALLAMSVELPTGAAPSHPPAAAPRSPPIAASGPIGMPPGSHATSSTGRPIMAIVSVPLETTQSGTGRGK